METAVWAIIGVGFLLWLVTGSVDRLRSEAGPRPFMAQSGGRHAANYRRLYGSHIAALKGLQRSGGWANEDDLRIFFGRAGSGWRNADGERSFASWLEPLTAAGYAELVPNGEARIVMITPFGVDFVRWMLSARVPELKPG